MKNEISSALVLGAAIITALIVVSCDTPTRTPTPPQHYGLEIALLNEVTRDAPIGQNLYLSGHFYNPAGEKQRGAKVNFVLEPSNLATITPYATTEPDSVRGFSTAVTFTGRDVGVVLIYAYVNDGAGLEVAHDTLYVNVIRWNG